MQDFFSLTPDALLDAVEAALGGGARATGRTYTLNSLENRVYDLELEEGRRVVAKFYRPGRWSRAAILQEHTLLAELVEAEVPVVAPFPLTRRQYADGPPFRNPVCGVPARRRPLPAGAGTIRSCLQIGRLLGRLA